MYPLSANAYGSSRTSRYARTGSDNLDKKQRARRAVMAAAMIESLETRTHLSVTHAASTYFGGSGDDVFRDAVVAPDGSVYLAGASLSTDLSLPPGGYDRTANGAGDVLVLHLSADLSTVLHATLLGGSGWEKNTYGIGLDAHGNVYVAGETRSTDFPTTAGARQRTFGGGLNDAFVAKLSGDLATLHYSTYLGGGGDDAARGGLAVDPASGQVTVVGWTGSANFPTTSGSYQPAYRGGTYDGFVTRLSADGGSLVWSTLIGGSFGTAWYDSEYVVGAALGGDGSVYFTGSSTSSDFPTTSGAYDRTHNGNGVADAFVGRLSADGKNLLWSTLLGGNGGGEFTEHRVAVDASGNVVVVGTASSSDFPVTTGRSHGGGPNDIFVAKVAAGGGSLLWSTLIGGSGEDSGFGPVIGVGGDVFVAGPSTSTNFPVTADAIQKTNGGGQDAVLVRLDGTSGRLAYATYLGGGGDDFVRFLAGDSGGNLYLTGETKSGNYPTTGGAADGSYGGSWDAFVTRVSVNDDGGTTPPAAAELDVWYGPRQLLDEDLKPVPFGTRQQFSSPIVYGFTIRNIGIADLALGDVVLSENMGFEIVRQPPAVLAPGASTTIYLRMGTDTVGEKRARVSIPNSDADESPFDFFVSGAVTPQPPEIQVFGNGWELADGSPEFFPFGRLQLGQGFSERTFVIRNSGSSDLYVQPAQLLNNTGFEIVRQPFHYLTPGGVTYLVLRMRSDLAGSLSADVRFGNTDADEGPFDFRVSGSVVSLIAPATATEITAVASDTPTSLSSTTATPPALAETPGVFSTRRVSRHVRAEDELFARPERAGGGLA